MLTPEGAGGVVGPTAGRRGRDPQLQRVSVASHHRGPPGLPRREVMGELENRIFKDIQWARPNELPKFDFLEADLTLVNDLAAGKLL